MRSGYKFREMLFLLKPGGRMVLMALHIFRHILSKWSSKPIAYKTFIYEKINNAGI